MRYIRGNVEREAGTKEMCSRLEAEGFKKSFQSSRRKGSSRRKKRFP